ncbi:hypothetical protein PPO43_15145 [Saprospira sp. CCB-QB6]|uniref:hypothetical protein n=1 Tax=Saprospira sp. CCB-QB6 TaxID=3023936 RepID=UPI002349D5EF|nr:hypothetical protein [Saprospira sp. CCB-QB6]WCL81310.1 hypothetical protein PPO43_15145 [Saprospira sp. CCB-QB6]
MVEITGWTKTENFVYTITKDNKKKMYLLAKDHVHKLTEKAASDPVIQDILNFVLPAYDDFLLQYRKNTIDKREYHQKTADFKALLHQLSSVEIRRWDIEIQMTYDVITSDYTRLLPDGREPFQKGTYDMRIEAVMTLGDLLSNDPQLQGLGATVLAFGQQLEDLRSQQQGVEGNTDDNVDDLETTRQELAIVLYGAFARLLAHYYRTPKRVDNFYELKYFRRGNSSSEEDDDYSRFEVDLAPESRLVQLEGLLTGGETVRITHLEGEPIKYYSAANAADSPAQVYELQPNQTVSLQLPAGHRLLLLDNPAANMAKVELELM